ncbi:GTPase HflX [Siphonobacter aquaeclarae]|uniref:GTPase HflX n=1 Tax=Siphonobacter aquaeclarae TaxID=563176 RepID=A0A1G9T350_9BACT|nr:GTPase HflX [Siphonobacter aquaeclarae]SDM42052.1 GTP-binding protein HflX [Siphonobacter aquaeclarae]
MFSTEKDKEKAVLIALITPKQTEEQTREYLAELEFLAETAGVETVKSFTQRLERPDLNTFLGKGRFEDVMAYVIDQGIDMIICDDDLSGRQIRNMESAFQERKKEVKIIDRSLLILNIFSMRAQTTQARTQIELAQQQYILPRLTRMWSHLSRQRGGVGMRGPGEKELETDKRLANDRIAFLKDKLAKIDRMAVTQRKNRDQMVRVALVGYTNVGKSTLMRRLAKAEVFAENKLFATVDSTVRKVTLDNIPFLLTDTVGFIRKLPTTLIEAFKSTLDEVREADILLHVVDVSHPGHEEQIQVVNQILAEIGAANKPIILVFNKIDLFRPSPEMEFEAQEGDFSPIDFLKNSYLDSEKPKAVFISAEQKENLEELRTALLELVKQRHYQIFPNSEFLEA